MNRNEFPRRFLGLAFLAACSGTTNPGADTPASEPAPSPPSVTVTRITVEDSTPADYRFFEPAPAELEGLLRKRLEAAGFKVAEAERDTIRLTLEARAAHGVTTGDGMLPTNEPPPPGSRTRAAWALEGKLMTPGSPGGAHFFIEGHDEAALAADAAGAIRAHLDRALEPLVDGLKARTSVAVLAAPELISKLDDPRPELRLAVVDQLGARREVSAVEALAARAKVEQDREVILRIVGALSEIGDDRAAQALIALANPRDREVLRAVLDALSVVGGPRVIDFLDILASHDAPDVREMVEDARNRVLRKTPQ